MKKLILNFLVVCVSVLLFSFVTDADKKLLGAWSFIASDAPEGYNQGRIEFADQDGKLSGKMITDQESFEMQNLKVSNDSITYELKVQSAMLQGLLVRAKDSLSGKIITPMGDLMITGRKLAAQ